MKIKNCLALILLFLYSVQIVFAQEKSISGGVVNGRATYLPKPVYPQEAKDLCVSGEVKVEVLISEKGKVVSARPISGDRLLQNSAFEAAFKAKFTQSFEIPVKVKGILVYNFVSERKCIEKGEVNSEAVYLPLPVITDNAKINCAGGDVEVAIMIDPTIGKVVSALPVSGHPLLQKSAQEAALKAQFKPTIVDGGIRIYVKAKLAYKIPYPKCVGVKGTLNKKAVNIPKPLLKGIIQSKYWRNIKTQIVSVVVSINIYGNVVFAEAISGHPLLRPLCEAAARKAKFLPTNDAPEDLIERGVITYKINSDGTVEV